MSKLEEALRCFAAIRPVADPVRHIAFRISGIENSGQADFVRRSLGILCAIGCIDPCIKRSHYKQYGPEDMDNCPPDVLAAICLRILNDRTMSIFGCSIEDVASDLVEIERRKS